MAPHALGNDREERFPVEALDGLRQTGFIGNPGGVRRRWGPTPSRTCCSSRNSAGVTLDRLGAPGPGGQLHPALGHAGAEAEWLPVMATGSAASASPSRITAIPPTCAPSPS
ncbi:hypothetical protein [Carbonactinospora thermoautotrophica]|uniref:hypothetical protein n=1 Tax=Carbonactinospora thermoautotrophica TaxID=1469144 RepID=UPI00227160A8|nr:hypothetical protein [Carbonactinospora thermoautotrophica]